MTIAISGEFGDGVEKFVWYRIENGRIAEREEINAAYPLESLQRQLANLQIDLLITGRISSELERALFDAGISVITGVNGKADQILTSYLNGFLKF